MNEGDIIAARAKLAEVDHFLLRLLQALKPVASTPVLPHSLVGLQDPSEFYEYIRGDKGELFPVMRESQLRGIEAILKYAAGKLPLAWCAYCLATAYHETARTMQGVREGLNVSDTWRRKNLRYYPWYGRGLVQLTWEANYKRAQAKLKELGIEVDLLADPDKALDLQISVVILVEGMLEGWFTGKKLRDYLPQEPTREQFANARRIVNLMDKADLIAGYAVEFEEALKRGEWL